MRRLVSIKTKESKESQNRSDLLASINREETLKEQLISDIEILQQDLTDLLQEHNSAKEELSKTKLSIEKKIKDFDKASFDLQTIDLEVIEKNSLLVSLDKQIKELENQIFVFSNKKQSDITELESSFENTKDKINKEIYLLTENIKQLNSEIADLKNIENAHGLTIQSQLSERKALDISIANRMKELASINNDLEATALSAKEAKKKANELDDKIKQLNEEMLSKDEIINAKIKEIAEKEQEVQNRRTEIVALSARSLKIDEKGKAVKKLFEAAGLDINL